MMRTMEFLTNISEIKEKMICDLLSTQRTGMSKLIDALEKMDFFTSPASANHHLNVPGGLLKHSYNVAVCADELAKIWLPFQQYMEKWDSIMISAYLHDVGKCGQFGNQMYVPNILKDGSQSTAKPYKITTDYPTIDHEIASIVEIQKYIELTAYEQQAILWHNGLYGPFRNEIQEKETDLYMIVHFADLWASRIVEKEE